LCNVRLELCCVTKSCCTAHAGAAGGAAEAARCLKAGRDFLITSIGVLTVDAFYAELVAVAESAGSQLMLASGTMPAVDWMSGASLAGAPVVMMTMCKPPRSW
jgi:aspartate dehydrogenase